MSSQISNIIISSWLGGGGGGGWHHTPETRKKISEGHKGKKMSQEWISKIIETKRRTGVYNTVGRKVWATRRKNGTDKHKPEDLIKMSLALKGRTAWNKGKIGCLSKETIRKKSMAMTKMWKEKKAVAAAATSITTVAN